MATRSDYEPGTIFQRQLDIFDPEKFNVPVHVIGVGATGSFDVLALAKLGFKEIHAWDDDIVEINNTAGQLYGIDDNHRFKVAALEEIVERLADIKIIQHAEKWDGQPLNGIVIMGADSIDTRRQIFEAVRFKFSVPLVIDHRIGGYNAQIFMFEPKDPEACEEFEATLFIKENASQLPCTFRSVIDINWFVASMAVRGIRSFLTGEPISFELHYDSKTGAFTKRDIKGAYKTLV